MSPVIININYGPYFIIFYILQLNTMINLYYALYVINFNVYSFLILMFFFFFFSSHRERVTGNIRIRFTNRNLSFLICLPFNLWLTEMKNWFVWKMMLKKRDKFWPELFYFFQNKKKLHFLTLNLEGVWLMSFCEIDMLFFIYFISSFTYFYYPSLMANKKKIIKINENGHFY